LSEAVVTPYTMPEPVWPCEAGEASCCVPWPFPVKVGNSEPCWAKKVSRAWRSAACAASMSGLACSASLISVSSCGEWKSVHHSPGMSMAGTKLCAAPPEPPAALVCGASDSGV